MFVLAVREQTYHGDVLTPEQFSMLKADVQQRFEHLTERWGESRETGKRCVYCGEWRLGFSWVGRDPEMCEVCFINGVLF